MRTFLDYQLLTTGFIELDVRSALIATIILLFGMLSYRIMVNYIEKYSEKHAFNIQERKSNKRLLFWITTITIVLLLLISLEINVQFEQYGLTLNRVLLAAVIVLIAKLLDRIIAKRLDEEIGEREVTKDGYNDGKGARLTQYIIIALCSYFLLKNFDFLNRSIRSFDLEGHEIDIRLSNVVIALVVILLARLVVWILTNFFLDRLYKRRSIDLGKRYAYNQLFSYLISFFSVLFALQYLGINMTLIWTGAAALLVGIGIALQQTISDFFSGIVLLFERSVQVGDFLEVGPEKGRVISIGLRASTIETRENKMVVFPNSKLVNDNVINWSQIEELTRFDFSVGVAYGSDTRKVEEILKQVAAENEKVRKTPKPFIRFLDFGDSALVFALYFYSKNFAEIEDIKSEMRFELDVLFKKHNIEIPFPQRDIWIKGSGKLD